MKHLTLYIVFLLMMLLWKELDSEQPQEGISDIHEGASLSHNHGEAFTEERVGSLP